MKKEWFSLLIVSMAFGTAWAVRGQFGHEQGAAWAGGIGGLALIMASGRKDWYSKAYLVALAAAVGWGAGGMISYGQVVGYGRSLSFLNASYGLLMLFVIGSLYGILGGGLVGLTLLSSDKQRINWGSLFSEMVTGGILGYYLLIYQFDWLMTPPREEAWSICLGAGLALIWHMARHNYISPIRVSLYSALGAGFGFAFGNFLQTEGEWLQIPFNMWNVMEYSIGFFGGLGMAFGVFSSAWPEPAELTEKWTSKIGMIIVFIAIPFINYIDSMGYNTLIERIKDTLHPSTTALISTISGAFIVTGVAITGWTRYLKGRSDFRGNNVKVLFIADLAAYIAVSYIVSGVFAGRFPSNHQLYWINLIIILLITRNRYPAFLPNPKSTLRLTKWFLLFIGIILSILLLSYLLINLHGEMGGSHNRF